MTKLLTTSTVLALGATIFFGSYHSAESADARIGNDTNVDVNLNTTGINTDLTGNSAIRGDADINTQAGGNTETQAVDSDNEGIIELNTTTRPTNAKPDLHERLQERGSHLKFGGSSNSRIGGNY